MNNKSIIILVGALVWSGTGFAQEINVTSTGVEVGAAGSSASGALIQQSGQTTSFVTKDGVNPPEGRMVIKPDGKVGVGTSAPTEKLEVAGNIKVNDAVLSPSGSAPIFGCRAWVNFDGRRNAAGVADTANTARFIRASGNVSSVVRVSAGTYRVIFTQAMPDANYAGIQNSNNSVTTAGLLKTGGVNPTSASECTVGVGDNNTESIEDNTYISVVVFR